MNDKTLSTLPAMQFGGGLALGVVVSVIGFFVVFVARDSRRAPDHDGLSVVAMLIYFAAGLTGFMELLNDAGEWIALGFGVAFFAVASGLITRRP